MTFYISTKKHITFYPWIPTYKRDVVSRNHITISAFSRLPMIGEKFLDMLGNDCPPPKTSYLRRGFQKPHHNLKVCFGSQKWLTWLAEFFRPDHPICDVVSRNHITILDPWPKKFGNQSHFGPLGQKNSATNHTLAPLAKKIRQPITLWSPWPKKNRQPITLLAPLTKKIWQQSHFGPLGPNRWEPILMYSASSNHVEDFGTLARQENCFPLEGKQPFIK